MFCVGGGHTSSDCSVPVYQGLPPLSQDMFSKLFQHWCVWQICAKMQNQINLRKKWRDGMNLTFLSLDKSKMHLYRLWVGACKHSLFELKFCLVTLNESLKNKFMSREKQNQTHVSGFLFLSLYGKNRQIPYSGLIGWTWPTLLIPDYFIISLTSFSTIPQPHSLLHSAALTPLLFLEQTRFALNPKTLL